MRMATRRFARVGLVAALAVALLLGGCGDRKGGKAGGGDDLVFTPIAPGTFAVVIDPNADVSTVEAAFRRQCLGSGDCTILGWTDPAAVAHDLVLSDAQTQSLAVRYVRHVSGQDEMMWDCVRFRAAKAPCLPKA